MDHLLYENVSWNVASIRRQISQGLSEKLFIEQQLKTRKYRSFKQGDRRNLLKDVFRLIKESGTV